MTKRKKRIRIVSKKVRTYNGANRLVISIGNCTFRLNTLNLIEQIGQTSTVESETHGGMVIVSLEGELGLSINPK